MNGKNHAIVGAASGIAVGIASIAAGNIEAAALAIPSALAGAKAPDMDHPKTKQGRAFNAFRFILPIVSIVLIMFYIYCWIYRGVKLNPLIVLIPVAMAWALRDGTWFWGHRHGTHTLIIPVILLAGHVCIKAAYPIIADVLLSFNAGYMSHLLADCSTYDGCPLLYPIYKKKISWSKIKSKEEEKCRVVAIILGAILIILSTILSFWR